MQNKKGELSIALTLASLLIILFGLVAGNKAVKTVQQYRGKAQEGVCPYTAINEIRDERGQVLKDDGLSKFSWRNNYNDSGGFPGSGQSPLLRNVWITGDLGDPRYHDRFMGAIRSGGYAEASVTLILPSDYEIDSGFVENYTCDGSPCTPFPSFSRDKTTIERIHITCNGSITYGWKIKKKIPPAGGPTPTPTPTIRPTIVIPTSPPVSKPTPTPTTIKPSPTKESQRQRQGEPTSTPIPTQPLPVCNSKCDLTPSRFSITCPEGYHCVDECLTGNKACPQYQRGVCRRSECLSDSTCLCWGTPQATPTKKPSIAQTSPTPIYTLAPHREVTPNQLPTAIPSPSPTPTRFIPTPSPLPIPSPYHPQSCTFSMQIHLVSKDNQSLPSSLTNKSIWKILNNKQIEKGNNNPYLSFSADGIYTLINNQLKFHCSSPDEFANPENNCDPLNRADYKRGEKSSWFLFVPENYQIVERRIDRCGFYYNTADFQCAASDIGNYDGSGRVNKGQINEIPGVPINCNMVYDMTFFVKSIPPTATPTPTPSPKPICKTGDESLLNKLHCGGLIIYSRHSQTEPSQAAREHEWDEELKNPQNPKLDEFFDNCDKQRLLSGPGRSLAQRIGQIIKQNNIPISEVITSAWCRTQETAALEFGNGKVVKDQLYDTGYIPVRSEARSHYRSALEQFFTKKPAEGTNRIIVSHMPQFYDLTGLTLQEAEAAIIEPQKNKFKILKIMRPDDWQTELANSSSPVSFFKSADINGDGQVTALDFSIIIAHLGSEDKNLNEDLDLNDDGAVNAIDLSMVLQRIE